MSLSLLQSSKGGGFSTYQNFWAGEGCLDFRAVEAPQRDYDTSTTTMTSTNRRRKANAEVEPELIPMVRLHRTLAQMY
jgi:hypothetical protein